MRPKNHKITPADLKAFKKKFARQGITFELDKDEPNIQVIYKKRSIGYIPIFSANHALSYGNEEQRAKDSALITHFIEKIIQNEDAIEAQIAKDKKNA